MRDADAEFQREAPVDLPGVLQEPLVRVVEDVVDAVVGGFRVRVQVAQ